MVLLLTAILFQSVHAVPPSAADTTRGVHYQMYTADGEPLDWSMLVDRFGKADVVFIGESHDDPIAHWFELEVVRKAHEVSQATGRPLGVSLEFFDRDVQYIVDEYLADLITEAQFKKHARAWDNYETDYKPMVEYAKSNGIPVVASNAPRRYVNRVTRLGPQSLGQLSEAALHALAPLPYAKASAAYQDKWDRMMASYYGDGDGDASSEHGGKGGEGEMDEDEKQAGDQIGEHPGESPHGDGEDYDRRHGQGESDEEAQDEERPGEDESANGDVGDTDEPAPQSHMSMEFLMDAQSLWDATMAFSIADHLLRAPGSQVVHAVGGFHVEEGSGIPEHLQRYRPGTNVMVIAVKPHDDINNFDDKYRGLGDVVVLTDEALPRSGTTKDE